MTQPPPPRLRLWGVHLPRELSALALDTNRLAIAWGAIGDPIGLAADRDGLKAALAAAYPDKSPRAHAIDAGTITRFVHEIHAGEFAIYPSKHNRHINIGRFIGGFEHGVVDGWPKTYPNSRRVDWIAHIPRDDLPEEARKAAGQLVSVFEIKRALEVFYDIIDA